jgi:protein transport protein SEC20
MIDESTQTIRATQTLYSRYESLLSTSSKLVKQLERADWYDRIIIISALLFFLLVVGFIVKRRVLDKAARGVGWWVGGSFKLVGMGLGQLVPGKRAAVVKVNSVETAAQTKLADVLESAVPAIDLDVKPVRPKHAEPSVSSLDDPSLVADTPIPVAATAQAQDKDEL